MSTVRPRPTYYESLGIEPTAASDEIAKAFAKATSVFRPHAFGAITEACLAYETLRNPIKRRAYDASIGLIPEPAPRVSPAVPREATSLRQAVSPYPVERTASVTVPPPAPQVNPTARPKPASSPSAGTRDRSPAPLPKPQPHNQADHKPTLAPQIGGDVPRHLSLEEQFEVEASPIDWKRFGKSSGAIAGAACFLGVLAGWWSAGAITEPQKPVKAPSLPLPRTDQAAASLSPPVPPQSLPEASPYSSKRAATAVTRIDSTPALTQFSRADDQPQASQSAVVPTEEIQPESSEIEPVAVEQDAPTDPLAPTVAAAMPLPNKVIARTIERIGYSCGAVTSSSPVEGDAPGVYKVTCASGQSYQAKPVNGRYRFRRWGRQ